jgi:hypothetical protein
MKLATHPFLLGLIVCVALVRSAHADERQSETVPGIDAYIRLSDRFRLYGTANLAQSLSEDVTDGDVGLYLDVLSLKEILPGPVLDLDWARNRYLWGRIGYSIGGIHEGLRLSNGYAEQAFVAELSGRYPISYGFWVVTRARIDMRSLGGDRSNRYRVRLGLEKEYTVLNRAVIPYVRAELVYDTRFDAWNRQIYQVGAEIGLNDHFRFEPWYAFQVDTAVAPEHLDRFGLTLKYYR